MDLNSCLTQLKKWPAESLIVLSVIYYWVMTGTILNPVALTLLFVMGSLFWFKNRALGIVISIVFLLLNMYMVLALFSELAKFSTFNKKALVLLGVGSTYLGLNIFLAIRMAIKWTSLEMPSVAKTKTHSSPQA